MRTNPDIIDLILERALSRPGRIDWTRIDRELSGFGATVERRLLHGRMKRLLAARLKPGWV